MNPLNQLVHFILSLIHSRSYENVYAFGAADSTNQHIASKPTDTKEGTLT
jgi:hypothetical protein